MIETTLARHDNVALCFSGGKDSLACVYMLRPFLDRITVYFMNTGDNLPEKMETVDHVRGIAPHFVTIHGDVAGWIGANGIPSDVVPYTTHPIAYATGCGGARIVSRFECCFQNVMWPCYQRVKADGNTLLIRGTKRADMKRLPTQSGDIDDGLEILHPVEDWTDADVLDYLRSVGAPISRVYETLTTLPDCAQCSAWWSEGRMRDLLEHHPSVAARYEARLRVILGELQAPMAALLTEAARIAGGAA